MADVILETTGTNDLRPKGDDGKNRNLIPYALNPQTPEASNALGTPDDPWYGATLASANYNFMYHCNYEYDRIIMGFEVIPNWATTYGRVNIMQSDTESGLAGRYTCRGARRAPVNT